MTLSIHRRSLELLRGEPALISFQTPEGIRRSDRRCGDCGSRLWSEPPRYPEIFGLRPGSLDDKSWLHPIAHIWTRSAQPWVPIPEDGLRYEKSPDDDLELVRAWKRRGAAERS
jgi:hypothetical protein